MDNTAQIDNSFNIDSVAQNPQFNFLNQIRNNYSDSPAVDFFANCNDSPYDNSAFKSIFVAVESLGGKPDSNKLRILTINIQSLHSKFSDLKELVASLHETKCIPDIICLQELWQFNDSTEFALSGYKPLVYKLRRGSVQGGGVGIFVHNNLDFVIDNTASIFFIGFLKHS